MMVMISCLPDSPDARGGAGSGSWEEDRRKPHRKVAAGAAGTRQDALMQDQEAKPGH